ncbi:hypothetical protein DFQ27_000350, partial [Actinomortierella ambigua]
LKACTLVCKAWYTTFQPAVWSKLYISELRWVDLCKCQIKEGYEVARCADSDWGRSFACNGHFIRHLELAASDEGELFQGCFRLLVDKCTSLTTLSFYSWFSEVVTDFEHRESTQSLVQAMID